MPTYRISCKSIRPVLLENCLKILNGSKGSNFDRVYLRHGGDLRGDPHVKLLVLTSSTRWYGQTAGIFWCR